MCVCGHASRVCAGVQCVMLCVCASAGGVGGWRRAGDGGGRRRKLVDFEVGRVRFGLVRFGLVRLCRSLSRRLWWCVCSTSMYGMQVGLWCVSCMCGMQVGIVSIMYHHYVHVLQSCAQGQQNPNQLMWRHDCVQACVVCRSVVWLLFESVHMWISVIWATSCAHALI